MTRESATKLTYEQLMKYGLKDWHVRLTLNMNHPFLGMCVYKDKCIILNAHHLDTHPDEEIVDTILHEVAHALCPGAGHNEKWMHKAIELGARPTVCSHLSFSPTIIDAIRSGADIKMEMEEVIVRTPKYTITRLQDKCEFCGAVAQTVDEQLIENDDDNRPNQKFLFLKCGHTLIKNIPKGTPFHRMVFDEDNDEEIKKCNHAWVINTCDKCGAHRPFKFQVDGMRFIEQAIAIHKGAAIFDEMGLGKTYQALGYIKYHAESWPVLYVVKSGIKYQWVNSIITALGEDFMPQVITKSSDYVIPGLKSYIISYDLLIPKTKVSKNGKISQQGFPIEKLIGKFKTIVLDECQQIKNPDASRTQQVRKLVKGVNVIALSGTPWKNRGSEFFSVLNMMSPLKFPSYQGYLDKWVQYYWDGKYRKEGGIRNPKKFQEYIADIAIRREYDEVMTEFPEVNRTKLPVEMDELDSDSYDAEEEKFVKWYNEQIIGGFEPQGINILAEMARMRHIIGLAKIPATEEFLEEFIENTDKKIAVFYEHVDVGNILELDCKKKFPEVPVFRVDGSTNPEKRFEIQEAFNAAPRAIFLGSTRATGEGINLQTCADAIMHEAQWNPQNEDQAAPGRFKRIGQLSKQVNVTFPFAVGTMDGHFRSIVERKRLQFHAGMNKGEMPKWDQNALGVELAQKIVETYNKRKKQKPVVVIPSVVPNTIPSSNCGRGNE